MTSLVAFLAIVSIARLTRLVTADTITAAPREWLQDRLPPKLGYLLGCPWCASMYVGAAVAAAVVTWPTNRLLLAALLALTGSHAAGFLATRESIDVVLHDPMPDSN